MTHFEREGYKPETRIRGFQRDRERQRSWLHTLREKHRSQRNGIETSKIEKTCKRSDFDSEKPKLRKKMMT